LSVNWWLMRRCLRKWLENNQPLGGSTGHQGTQGWQGSGPERHSEQVPDTSTKAWDNLCHENINAVLRRQYFPPAWKHACVVSVVSVSAMQSSPYRPTS
jgi:hypothetical protein